MNTSIVTGIIRVDSNYETWPEDLGGGPLMGRGGSDCPHWPKRSTPDYEKIALEALRRRVMTLAEGAFIFPDWVAYRAWLRFTMDLGEYEFPRHPAYKRFKGQFDSAIERLLRLDIVEQEEGSDRYRAITAVQWTLRREDREERSLSR